MIMSNERKWVKSGGGPLICIERDLAHHWRGVEKDGATIGSDSENPTDYMRACSVSDYLGKIKVGAGHALILGDMPIQTMIRQSSDSVLEIVRIYYADPGDDVIAIIDKSPALDFSDPVETTTFDVGSGRLVIFDSAFSGDDSGRGGLSLVFPPSSYVVATKQFNLNDRTSTLIHKFSPRH
jgi:hypothetical protein